MFRSSTKSSSGVFTDAGADLQFNSDGSPAEDANEHDPNHELYPTESRVKQKEKEKAHKEQTGEKYVPKKRPVVIQPGDDDCGEDDSSILEDTGEVFHYSDVPPPPKPYTFRQIKNFLTYFEGNYNPSSRLFGSGASDLCPFHQQKFDSMTSFLTSHCSTNHGQYTDVFELCGGSARVSIMLVTRRHITKGPNFDIVVGIDLHDRKEIEGLWIYMRTRKPACGIISTPCTGLKGFSGLNRAIHREGWDRSRYLSVPLGELGGQVALFQLNNDAHFIAENPQGSELWELPSWKRCWLIPERGNVLCISA